MTRSWEWVDKALDVRFRLDVNGLRFQPARMPDDFWAEVPTRLVARAFEAAPPDRLPGCGFPKMLSSADTCFPPRWEQ